PDLHVMVKRAAEITTDNMEGTYSVSDGVPPLIGIDAVGDELEYQWYENTSNSNIGGTPIPNTNIPYGLPDVTAAGTYYYYVTVSGACNTAGTSGVAKVVVDQNAVAGTISGATEICEGANSVALLLSNYTGTIQWQSSTDNVSFTNI